MGSRLDLQKSLEEILGSRQVYFQPPETVHMIYPAIVYNLSNIYSDYADDVSYTKHHRYSIVLMHLDPDNEIKEKLIDLLKCCRFVRVFCKDNIYHYVYDVYY